MQKVESEAKRLFLRSAALAGSGLILPAASLAQQKGGLPPASATEELMREHGILRRALLVYRVCATRLHANQAKGLAKPLNDTAKLFRRYGEDFHERPVEEQYVFPRVMQLAPPVSRYPSILMEQHKRGRDITDYVMQVTGSGTIPSGSVKALANTLDAFDLMYEVHAAREDTVVYVAWKNALSPTEFDDMTQKFDEITQRLVGHDGFTAAEVQISSIEEEIGASNLAQFTAPLVKGR